MFEQDGLATLRPETRPTAPATAFEVGDIAAFSGNCLEVFGVRSDGLRALAEEHLRDGHDRFSGARFAELVPEVTETLRAAIAEEGTAFWCLGAEARLRKRGLALGIDGPSFDCIKAATQTERAICGSADLWAFDRAMANLYHQVRAGLPPARSDVLKHAQREWIRAREDCGASVSCLSASYNRRIADLLFW